MHIARELSARDNPVGNDISYKLTGVSSAGSLDTAPAISLGFALASEECTVLHSSYIDDHRESVGEIEGTPVLLAFKDMVAA